MKAQFLQFLILSFYYLGLSSALKAPNQLVWLLLKNCQCLTFICAIIYLCSDWTHQLGLDLHHPWCLRSPFKRLLLLLFNVRLSQVNLSIIKPQDVYKKESRRTLLIRDQISSSGYWDHLNDKMNESQIQLWP
jgi:hypothetical protein